MSILKRERGVRIYAGITLFCLLVFFVYDRFSHDVRSPYMTFLFAWPLVLGFVPALLFGLFPNRRRPGLLALDLYNCGVAALTLSSLLRGIFEIAGTGSVYQGYLMIAGAVLAAAGAAAYAGNR